MKVLIITNMYPTQRSDINHYGIFVKEQVEALQNIGNLDIDTYLIDGFKSKINYLKSIYDINKKIEHNDYDLIHIHYALSGLFLLFTSKKIKEKTIITFHGGDILIKQKKYIQVFLSRLIARQAKRLVVLNNEMLDITKKIDQDSKVIPCGVDTDFFVPKLGNIKKVETTKILFGADPNRWVKNYPLFLEIIDKYKNISNNFETIALGSMNREQVKENLQESKVLILTSHSEGSPQIIKEALSCDIAIISSDVGDVASILGNTPGTYVFEKNTSLEYIAEKIDKVIYEATENPGVRRKRIIDLGLDNKSIARKIHDEYTRIQATP